MKDHYEATDKKWALGNSNALLITGTGRNGTTYVARALKAMNPNLTVGHEIEPKWVGCAESFACRSRK